MVEISQIVGYSECRRKPCFSSLFPPSTPRSSCSTVVGTMASLSCEFVRMRTQHVSAPAWRHVLQAVTESVLTCIRQHASAYAYGSIRQHTSAYV
jgi:hypothetical protein